MILLDLFSGYGGFHKGLCEAGFIFNNVYYSEIDKHAIANYRYNYEKSEYIGSVESIFTRGIERPDIITFGSPCQDFSIAGKRNGLDGKRSSLISYALEAISNFRPDVFIWENVKGCFSSNNSEDFWTIIKAFANIGGYRIEWQLFNTAWFLPQNRERIYLVGRIADKCTGQIFPFGQDDELYPKKNETKKRRTQAKYCSTIKRGFGNKADDMFIISHYRHRDKRARISDFCPTLKAESHGHTPMVTCRKTAGCLTGGGHSGGLHGNMEVVTITELNHKHGGKERYYVNIVPSITQRYGTGGDNIPYVNNLRRLTEIECERLQGLPDNFTKYGNYNGVIKEIPSSQRYKLLGNGITIKVVERVGNIILKNTTFHPSCNQSHIKSKKK
ncbi:MAG: DNA cytosine methyltransferase [Mediterranea sp.]|jgi:DNA (cytosine-5)-methyltransferase 1|nr:DNA cytosine methyltransferase [Mediterranea sp.]